METIHTMPEIQSVAQPQERPYTYETLRHVDSFRVMTLLPGQAQDAIELSLSTVRVCEKPHYNALSYVWGNASKVERVTVYGANNTGILYRTVNLCDALRAMRRKDHPVTIWADAVCINQVNNLERNHQVKQMATIYSSAANVYVWLGKDAEGLGKKGIDAARRIARQDGYTAYRSEPLDDVKALEILMQRDWFSRVWTIQEIGLARSATVLCGQVTADWDYLHTACNVIAATWRESEANQLSSVSSRIALLRQWTTSDESFLSVLDSFGWYAASDPRDHVFALLSHGSAMEHGSKDLVIQPDYNMSLSEVYIATAISVFESTQGLELLSFVRYPSPEEFQADVPSWVPQWHMRRKLNSLDLLIIDRHEDEEIAYTSFEAKAHLSSDKTRSPSLVARAAICGKIRSRSDPLIVHNFCVGEDAIRSSDRYRHYRSCELSIKRFESEHIAYSTSSDTSNPNEDLLTSMFLMNNKDHEVFRLKTLQERQEMLEASCYEFVDDVLHRLHAEPKTIWRALWLEMLASCSHLDLVLFLMSLMQVSTGRCAFTLDTGEVGLGPPGMQESDHLVKLDSCQTFHVLRRSGVVEGAFTLIGDAFVPSLVNGKSRFQRVVAVQLV